MGCREGEVWGERGVRRGEGVCVGRGRDVGEGRDVGKEGGGEVCEGCRGEREGS